LFVSASEVYRDCLSEIDCSGKTVPPRFLWSRGEADANMYLCSVRSGKINGTQRIFKDRRKSSAVYADTVADCNRSAVQGWGLTDCSLMEVWGPTLCPDSRLAHHISHEEYTTRV